MGTNELKHVGVLGMRWGRRKSESSSGSRGSKKKSSVEESADHKTISALKKKKVNELSNDEIRKVATRIQLEMQYRSLNPKGLDKGKKTVDDTIKTLGYITTSAATVTAAVLLGKKIYTAAKTAIELSQKT